MKFHLKFKVISLIAAILTGCSGGSSINEKAETNALVGVVIDGPIQGARVCLDLNVNLACDIGEPSAITAQNGSFSLGLADLSVAKIRTAHIIVNVPLDAKDSDDGDQTLEQSGKAPFNLMSPAEAFVSADGATIGAAIVSPLTTLISHEMMSGAGKTTGAAEIVVAKALGLAAGINLRNNFVGLTDASSLLFQKQARFIAVALGEVKKSIATQAGSSSDRERQLGALHYIRTNASSLVTAMNSSIATTSKAQWQAAKTALANPSIMPTPDSNGLVSAAKEFAISSSTLDATSADFASIVAAGFYEAWCSSGGGSGSGTEYFYICNKWALQRIIGDGLGQARVQVLTLSNSTWIPGWGTSQPYPSLSSKGWTNLKAEGEAITILTNEQGDAVMRVDANEESYAVRVTTKDIGGVKLADLLGSGSNFGLSSIASSLTTLDAMRFKNTVLPTGSKVYSMSITSQLDRYQLTPGMPMPSNGVQASFANFDEFRWAYTSSSTNETPSYVTGVNLYDDNLVAQFDTGGTTTEGTVSVWAYSSTSYGMKKLDNKGRYEIRTVFGEQLLFVFPPESVIKARSSPKRESFFATLDGKVRFGQYASLNYQKYFTSATTYWNNVGMDAILAAADLPLIAK